jgi:hypothetical protein
MNISKDVEEMQQQIRLNKEARSEVIARMKERDEAQGNDRALLAALDLADDFWFTPNKGEIN